MLPKRSALRGPGPSMSAPGSKVRLVSRISTRSNNSSVRCSVSDKQYANGDSFSNYNSPDARGHFGPYGGIFVGETLMPALELLNRKYAELKQDPAFWAEFDYDLTHYVG